MGMGVAGRCSAGAFGVGGHQPAALGAGGGVHLGAGPLLNAGGELEEVSQREASGIFLYHALNARLVHQPGEHLEVLLAGFGLLPDGCIDMLAHALRDEQRNRSLYRKPVLSCM